MSPNKVELWFGVALIIFALFLGGLALWMDAKNAQTQRQLIPVNIEQSMVKVK